MIIDGKALAADILARTKARAAQLAHPPKVVAFYASETPATRSYLAIKTKRATDAGCVFEARTFPLTTEADAIIVQLPLYIGMDQKSVLDAIPVEKDADVLSSAARERFAAGAKGALLPPVVGAIAEIFARNNVNPRGKRAVVIGEGWLVGAPVATWLKQQKANVEILNSKTGDLLPAALCAADIIVSGAGVPGLIKPDMIKEATANARAAAEKFAQDSKAKVGAIRRATQGVLEIEDRDVATPEIKVLRVVTTVDFFFE